MYSLKLWQKPNSGEIRLYIGGTTRQDVYLLLAGDGLIKWSSKAHDTPHKFQTGDHYGKVKKDREAASEVAKAFSIPLGDGSTREDWERACQLARDGIQIAPRDDDDEIDDGE